ncbi:5-hydroxytryptamine receptor-like [Mytilus californianus]|uniref:5-hydroxytryptamine receptor-like n=1 Tax=Mytilus californianus TaxID=6549 RepID=UPI0022460577|nr:5-hydroxytryptamine receptor-like [Mytilus californianus]
MELTTFYNTTFQENITETPHKIGGPQIKSLGHLVGTSVVLGLMILATIIGNVFVIAAIILEKNLHNVANYLILSLAVADLMVATLVMPLSVVSEVSEVWFLGGEVCDMWISFDVLCCTSSILHLVAISVDRYWAVTNIDYIRNRTARRILLMIAMAWTVGMFISIPPLFGWKDETPSPEFTGKCIISQIDSYTVFSTIGAFYLPTVVMLIIYVKIFQVARSRIRRKNFNKKQYAANKNVDDLAKSSLLKAPPSPINGHTCSTDITLINETSCNGMVNGNSDKNDNSKVHSNALVEQVPTPKGDSIAAKAKRAKEKLEMKRERKAARTLGIITGAYIVCWLPFFLIALIGPLGQYEFPPVLHSIVLWLGYFNSLLNPIIYTIFSPEFRHAFHKILFGKYSQKSQR